MEQITFKTGQVVDTWQWVALIAFCVLLVSLAIIANRYGKKLRKQSGQDTRRFTVEQQRISQSAVIYHIYDDSEKFIIFESKNGVLQLQSNHGTERSDNENN